jgi:hypothetical protein
MKILGNYRFLGELKGGEVLRRSLSLRVGGQNEEK